MKTPKHTYLYKILLVILIINLGACSKDQDDPLSEITVSTSDFSITMDENPTKGQVIGTVDGSTNQGKVTFSITEQNPADAFSIDAISGELKVEDETLFNFKTNPLITGIVKVANGGVSQNAAVSIILTEIFTEKIFVGNVTLTTQAEVEAFGREQYTHITGITHIGFWPDTGVSDIEDISSLNSLTNLGSFLMVGSNPKLPNLKGLENIKYIDKGIVIVRNASLTTLKDLNPLLLEITIDENHSLKNLDGLNFEKLDYIEIKGNNSLQNIDGLSQLKEAGTMYINNNTELVNIQGLQSLKSLGNLSISDNSSLQNISGLEGLTSLNGTLTISNNDLLESIDPLRNLITLPNEVNISENLSLQSISILKGLTIAKNINIINNPALKNLEGLENITRVIDRLNIVENRIQNINELSNLKYVGALLISDNQGLENLGGLIKLETITGSLRIKDNQGLKNLDDLQNLNYVGSLIVDSNTNLSDLCGLRNLLINNGLQGDYWVSNNAYNPTKQDIIDGNCRL